MPQARSGFARSPLDKGGKGDYNVYMQMKQNFESPKYAKIAERVINKDESIESPKAALTVPMVLSNIHFTIQKFAAMGRNDYEIPTLMKLANDLQNGKISASETEKTRQSIEFAKDAYDYN
jgi:hypothetical protein